MRERTKRGLRRLGSGLLALAMVLSLLPAMGVTIAQAANGDAVVEVDIVGDDYQTVKAYVTPYVGGTGQQAVPIKVESTSKDVLYKSNTNMEDWQSRAYYVYGLEATLADADGTDASVKVGRSYMVKSFRYEVPSGFPVLQGPEPESTSNEKVNSYIITSLYAKVPLYKEDGQDDTDYAFYWLRKTETPERQFVDYEGWGSPEDYVDYNFANAGVTFEFEAGANEFEVSATTSVFNFEQSYTKEGNKLGSQVAGVGNTGTVAITIYAPYELTLDLNDSAEAPANEYNGEVTTTDNGCYKFPDAVPTRNGYVFVGWSTSKNGGGTLYSAGQSNIKYYVDDTNSSLTFSTQNKNTTLYAQWRKLTYDGNIPAGASEETLSNMPTGTQVNDAGQLVIPANVPILAGYTFLGWNDQQDGSGTWYKNGSGTAGTLSDPKGTMTVTADTTLYAQWQAGDEKMVILQDTTYNRPEKTRIVQDDSYALPTAEELGWNPIHEDTYYNCEYHFAGWQVSGDTSTTSYQPGETYTLTDNVTTFTAVWEKYYVVTFDPNLGKAGSEDLENPNAWVESIAVKAGESFNLPDTETWTTNYRLTGWSESTTGSSSSTTYAPGDSISGLTQNTTYYARWTQSGRVIDIQGCSGVTEGQAIRPFILVRFPGGQTTVSLEVTYNSQTVTYKGTNGAFTLFAGESGMYYVQMDPIVAHLGETLEAKLYKTSSTGTNWSDTKTVTLTAEPVDPAAPDVTQYTVTYLPGVVPDTSDTMSAQSMPSQDKVTENSAYTVNGNTSTASGYTFQHWLGSDGKTYQPGQQITSVDGNITLTAVWEKTAAAGQYALTYSAGENVTDAQNIPDSRFVTAGTAFFLSSQCPTRPGYTFQGWSDGKGNTYQPGAGFADGITTDLTLTAVWQQIGTVTITYENGNAADAVNIPSKTTAEQNSSYTIPSVVPTRTGYTFTGWSDGSTTYQPGDTIAVGTSAITLTAQWTRNKVTIEWPSLPTGVTGSGNWPTTTTAFEGQTVTLTATVKDGENPVTSGSVEFFQNGVSLGTAQVNGGQATLKATMSDYNAQGGIEEKWDTFYAKFIPSGSYAADTSEGVAVQIRSTWITWEIADSTASDEHGCNKQPVADADKLIIKQDGQEVDSMVAGRTYTLEIPDVYALGDEAVDGWTPLSSTEYQVVWEKQTDGQSWVTLNTTDTTLTVTSYEAGDVYRAKVYPLMPYTGAMALSELVENMYYTPSEVDYLLTQATGAVTAQDTTTTIGVSKTSDVGGAPAQFEGETVLLYAQVFELNGTEKGDAIPSAGTVSFYRGKPEADQTNLLGTVDVSVLGFASLDNVTISAYDSTGTKTSDTFYAVFNGSDTYASSRTDGGEGAENAPVSVTIRSTAIAWTTENGEEQNKLLVYRGNSTKDEDRLDDQSGFTMLAGSTYTLKIPAVQEQGQDGVQLAYTTGYTITWYEIDKSGNANEIAHTTGNTVVVTPATSGVRYYAEVHPAAGSHYTDAWQGGKSATRLTTITGEGNYTSAVAGTVTDLSIAGAVNGAQYGGKELTLTASVKVKNPQYETSGGDLTLDVPVINRGVVNFYVFGLDENGDPVAERIGNDAVNLTNGTASVTCTVPPYSLGDGLENILYFYAVYSDVSTSSDGSTLYGGSNSTTVANDDITTGHIPADDQVQILSTAISWALAGTDDSYQVATDASAITITIKGTSDEPDDGVMIAGKTYTLTIPEVYAFDQAAGAATALKAGTDYTVTWQIQDAQGSWTIYNNLTGKTTDSVDVTPAESGANFRAVIYPAGGPTSVYNTAAVYAGVYEGEVTGLNGQVLYSAPTTAIDQQATETTLTIMYADDEAGDVWINGGTPFADSIDEHLAQFEGQTVILEATVVDGNGDPVTSGSVYFYRYVDGVNDEKLNAAPVLVNDSVARLETATISAYDTSETAVNNVDRFYAVYQANGAYAESASVEKDEETGKYVAPVAPDTVVYIKSATIDIPVIVSTIANAGGETETTKTGDLSGLQSGVSHTFTLKATAGAGATEVYSVVALDGRAVDSNNYTIQWFTNTGNGEGAISGATTAEYQPANVESGDTFHIHLIPTLTGDMVKGVLANGNIGQYAESKKAIIGDRQDVNVTVTASDGIDSTDEIDVYQSNTVTLTATVAPTEASASAQPTGSVTFYYSVDGGATWTQLADAVNVATVGGKTQASLTTDQLPVKADGTHQTVTITAIYSGDGAFAPSGSIDNEGAIDTTDGCEVTPVNVTVYSSVVYASDQYQNVVTTVTAYDKEQGIVITGQLTANEAAVLTLSDVYTKNYADVSDTLAKLAYGTDYTVQWQKLPNAAAYGDKVADAAGWEVITGAAGKTCSITVEDGAAYRAVVTVLDTARAKGSYQSLDGADRTYNSNIVTSGKGDLTLTISTTSSDQSLGYEGIVAGETVTIRALMSGANGVTPIANLTAAVTKDGETVYESEASGSVSGVVAFQWTENVTPGVYTITVKAEPSNGYAAKEVSKTVIVRDNDYTISVTDETVPYNGQTQGVAVAISGMDIESGLASKSWTVKYYADEARTQLVEPNQAGTYYYTATLPASAYWTEKSVKGTFTIEKREVTILDLVAQAKVYDGTTKANLQEIVLSGTISGDSIYAMGEGYTASAKGGATTLGVQSVQLLGDDAANYTLTNPTYTENFTIQRNQVQGAVAQGVTFAYTGQDITFSRDQIYLIDQQGNRLTNYEIYYYYFNGEGLEKVSAMNRKGQYLVEAKPDQTNYKDGACALVQVGTTASAGTLDTNFTSATIDITNTVATYGAATGVTAAASNGTVTVSYYYDSSWQTAVPTDAGRYLVKAVASTGDTAYGLYTIVKARPTLSLTLGADTVTYDSALHDGTPTLTGDNGAEVYYSYAGDVTGNVAYQAPHDAGSYVVTAHVGETANYTAHEVSAVLTIDKAALTITADNLQRQQYSAYPDMVASYSGLATKGVAADTSLRDVQIQPEFNADWNNFALDHTGDYPITPVSALAKNYVITYVDGAYTVTYGDPNVTLAIHGLPESGSGETGLVYVGDEIQLYAYGTKMGGVTNGSSAISWTVNDDSVATINGNGVLRITGAGTVTVTLTRGTGDTAISTSVPLTAARKEVQVDMADQTVTYSGSEQTYSSAVAGAVMSNTARTDAGSQVVTAKVDDATHVSETYGGLFTVEKKTATVTPNAATTEYGTAATGISYTDPEGALTDGQAVSIADAYNRLDVGDYEILVAGRENLNYAVTYVTGANAPQVSVTKKQATITTGSYADNVGVTGGSVDGDYPAEGAIFDTSKPLGDDNIRMYGEPNWVMGYQIKGLVDGDSEADLAAALQKLVDFDFDIEAEANLDYQSKKLMNGKDNYTITSLMDFGNYTITVTEGTQNVYQRPVALQIQGGQTLSLLYAQLKDETAAEQEAMVRELLLNNLSVEKYNDNGKLIGGLATLLGHTAQDLTYDIQVSGSIDSGYTVTVQATGNYWSEETTFTVSVVKQGYVVEYHNDTFSATSMTVTLYMVNADGDRTAAYLPDDQLVLEIYKKLDEDENNRSYAYYQQQGAECLRRVIMTKVPGSTGLYTATYDKLPGRAYYRCFAIPSGSGYVIVG